MLLIALCMILQAKGVQDSATAAVRVSGLELGGLAGSLTAGFLSDKLVARAAETGGGMVGARVKVCLACASAFEGYSHRAKWLQSNLSGFGLQDSRCLKDGSGTPRNCDLQHSPPSSRSYLACCEHGLSLAHAFLACDALCCFLHGQLLQQRMGTRQAMRCSDVRQSVRRWSLTGMVHVL